MTRTTAALTFALALAAAPAALAEGPGSVDGQVAIEMELVDRGADGLFAVTRIDSRNGVPIDGSLAVAVRGSLLKIEPVATMSSQEISVRVGDSGDPASACVSFAGRARYGTDTFVPTAAKECERTLPRVGAVVLAPTSGPLDRIRPPSPRAPRR